MALFIGSTLLEFEALPSTNAFATEWVSKSQPNEGTVVLAEHQTQGKGQLGSVWQSKPQQNLTFSLILYPKFVPPTAQFSFNQAIALGLYDAVRTYVDVYAPSLRPNIDIKWSNDLLINEKKVAGVLIENSLSANTISSSVVGIGINLNQTDFEGLPHATSLAVALGTAVDRLAFRQILFDTLEARYLQLRAGQSLQTAYLAHLYRFGIDACYEIVADKRTVFARIVGVTPVGKLELLTERGIEVFNTKEIRFL